MSEYEITYITNPQLPEEARGQLDAAIDAQISELGGLINSNAPHIRRRLAYPLSKQTSAFLRLIQIELPAEQVSSLRLWLKKQAGVLRTTILQTAARQAVSADILEPAFTKTTTGKPAKTVAKPARAVTMEDVEKGIEEALMEEVK